MPGYSLCLAPLPYSRSNPSRFFGDTVQLIRRLRRRALRPCSTVDRGRIPGPVNGIWRGRRPDHLLLFCGGVWVKRDPIHTPTHQHNMSEPQIQLNELKKTFRTHEREAGMRATVT